MCCQTNRGIGRSAPPPCLVFKSTSSGSFNIQVNSPNRKHKISPMKKHKFSLEEKGILAGICKKKKRESLVQRIPKVISHKYANGVISYIIPKVISHKYANGVISYLMIYSQVATLGLLQKKGERRRKVELRMFHLNPQRGHLSQAPLPPLYNAPRQPRLHRMSR